MRPAESKVGLSLKAFLRIFAYVFLALFLFQFIQGVLGDSYDWDVDHEMYFGSRLLRGELLYTQEYHEKFPVVQYLFALPAFFQSISVWVLFSSLTAIIAAFSMYMVLRVVILEDWPSLERRNANSIALFASTFYLFFVSTVIPGSLYLINTIAANTALISVVLLLYCSKCSHTQTRNIAFAFIISAMLAAISISIRPYLAPSLVMLGIWMPLRRNILLNKHENEATNIVFTHGNPVKTIKKVAIYAGIWALLLIIAGAAINIFPYVLSSNFDAFYDGIIYNSQKLIPRPYQEIIASQLRVLIGMGNTTFTLFALALIVPACVLINRLLKFRCLNVNEHSLRLAETDLLFSGLIPILLLESTILGRHFWPHYVQLFAPFTALSLAFSLSYISGRSLLNVKINLGRSLALSLTIVILVLFTRNEIISSFKSIKSYLIPHSQSALLKDVKIILQNRSLLGQSTDFLDASETGMYVHWKLGESRHGFPNATNIDHIFKGWLVNLKKSDRVEFSSTPTQICRQLLERGPSIVFSETGSPVTKCLNWVNSTYDDVSSEVSIPLGNKVFFKK